MVSAQKSNSGAPAPPPAQACVLKWGQRGLILALGWVLYSVGCSYNHIFYRLDPTELNKTVQSVLASASALTPAGSPSNATLIIDTLVHKLAEDHPQIKWRTDWQNRDDWVFNNAGGAMGSMYLLHSSLTEYLIIFGSAIGTEGHSGRHPADDWFHILTGRQHAYEAGALEREVYNPGDVNWMKRGVVKQYGMEPETWALEYARGWIPLMLPFGFADMVLSTMDVHTMFHTVRITGKEMILNLLRGKI
ncbi:hypothetical protein I350_05698 [Cryptococcus amylolentus CBS 6273]|uniref:C-8 sterol isomerase n=1 Tax=Cryptococcus amylolentus CBS 6273 TaxID=1296118 RepID=A0A1E3JRX6_9TREE|nr:hypothetical protein I350_05698 [Cryptococcus amylolentus CBS 6273]